MDGVARARAADDRRAVEAQRAFVYVLGLIGPLALVLIGTKIHKLATASAGLGATLGALTPDLVVVSIFAGLAFLSLRVSGGASRPWSIGTRVLLHALTFGATVLAFVEHGFWVVTGSLLDPHVLGYGLSHFGSLGKVYLSAMGPIVWFGLTALVVLHALPVLLVRRIVVSSRARRWTWASLIALMALASLVRATTDLGALRELSRSTLPTFAAALFVSPPEDALASRAEPFAELVTGHASPAVTGRANVIVIMMESVRARSTTPYAPDLDTTPFLASLAARGGLVEEAWTTVTHTSKALVGALCGIYPVLDLPVSEAEPTGLPTTCLARALRDRGYATAFMQTATATFEQRRQIVENMGYEEFRSKESIPQGRFEETSYFGWEDRALLEPALGFIAAQRAAGRPYFLTLLNLSTHHTYQTPSTFATRHRADGDLDDYLNSLRYFDDTLRDLFAGLEAQGALKDTLIILAGDHGEAFGEHGSRQHNAAIYEEGLHVPVVMVGPGIAPGTRIPGLRQLIDLSPTVLAWLGTPVTSGLPGRSLFDSEGHDALFASCWLHRECIATRSGRYKYVWNFERRDPELFDLVRDPLERDNILAATPSDLWQPMRDRLLQWKAEVDGRWDRFLESGGDVYVQDTAPDVATRRDVVFSTPATSTRRASPLARLIGIDPPPLRVVSGETIPVTLHWEVLGEMSGWYAFTLLVGHGDGALASYDANHGIAKGRHPIARWEPGTFVSDAFEIRPETPLPAGTYDLVIGFFAPSSESNGTAARATAKADSAGVVDGERRAHVLRVEVVARAAGSQGRGATETTTSEVGARASE